MFIALGLHAITCIISAPTSWRPEGTVVSFLPVLLLLVVLVLLVAGCWLCTHYCGHGSASGRPRAAPLAAAAVFPHSEPFPGNTGFKRETKFGLFRHKYIYLINFHKNHISNVLEIFKPLILK